MKAMLYKQFNMPPEIVQVDSPRARSTSVVVEVKATGLCRSDWHGWKGHDADIRLPHVPGHEFAGIVCDVGKQVKQFQVGDRVTVPFVGGCGHCPECDTGNQQICRNQFQPGFTAWGSFAEYVKIEYADTNLVHLPPDIDFITAASLGCRFATAFRAVVDQAQVTGGEWVAVYGCGGLGLSCVMIAHALGAQVIAIDTNDKSLLRADSIGADFMINPKQVSDVAEAVRDISDGGVHVSIDALGSADLLQQSVLSLCRQGRHIQIGLIPPEAQPAGVPMDRVIAYELTLLGSHGMQAWRYPEMIRMIQSGKLQPKNLIGHICSLKEAATLLPDMNHHPLPGVTIIDSF